MRRRPPWQSGFHPTSFLTRFFLNIDIKSETLLDINWQYLLFISFMSFLTLFKYQHKIWVSSWPLLAISRFHLARIFSDLRQIFTGNQQSRMLPRDNLVFISEFLFVTSFPKYVKLQAPTMRRALPWKLEGGSSLQVLVWLFSHQLRWIHRLREPMLRWVWLHWVSRGQANFKKT